MAAVGFGREAGTYDRIRPSYPRAVVEGLVGELGRGARVCDLGAGTGIFTAQLVGGGFDVVAVEPLEQMRCELVARDLPVTVLDGTSGAIPLGDGGVDGVTVAQAFHWFEPRAALEEIARVLRVGGTLMLVWNVRDESVAWVHELTELVHRVSGGRPYTDHRDHRWEAVVAASGRFGPVRVERYPNPVLTTPDGVVARVRSTSFVAAMDPDAVDALSQEVRYLIASHPDTAGRERFEYPHDTVAYVCRRV